MVYFAADTAFYHFSRIFSYLTEASFLVPLYLSSIKVVQRAAHWYHPRPWGCRMTLVHWTGGNTREVRQDTLNCHGESWLITSCELGYCGSNSLEDSCRLVDAMSIAYAMS